MPSKFSAAEGQRSDPDRSGDDPIARARAELAPDGVLRAGINLGNFLLVKGTDRGGNPTGVAPGVAAEVARRLGVRLKLVPFPSPGALADAADTGAWDIGLLGADPMRAGKISFTPAYCEIEASYMVPSDSPLRDIASVDRPGVRIAVNARSAYDLWLERNIRHATLVRVKGTGSAFDIYRTEHLDALAGLRPGLLGDLDRAPGHRVLEGRFMAVQQAIGLGRNKPFGEAFLRDFVEDAKAGGLIARLISEHGVIGLSVAAPA